MGKQISELTDERKSYLDELVRKSKIAAAVFTQYTQEDVDKVVKPMVIAGLDSAQYLAGLGIA